MWPIDYLNMCHIFYYNISVNFLQSTWIRPQNTFFSPDFKNFPNFFHNGARGGGGGGTHVMVNGGARL